MIKLKSKLEKSHLFYFFLNAYQYSYMITKNDDLYKFCALFLNVFFFLFVEASPMCRSRRQMRQRE